MLFRFPDFNILDGTQIFDSGDPSAGLGLALAPAAAPVAASLPAPVPVPVSASPGTSSKPEDGRVQGPML